MNELIRRIAFAIQDEEIGRLKAQRIVVAVLAALDHGDRIGTALTVRSVHPQADGDRDQRFCSWD